MSPISKKVKKSLLFRLLVSRDDLQLRLGGVYVASDADDDDGADRVSRQTPVHDVKGRTGGRASLGSEKLPLHRLQSKFRADGLVKASQSVRVQQPSREQPAGPG